MEQGENKKFLGYQVLGWGWLVFGVISTFFLSALCFVTSLYAYYLRITGNYLSDMDYVEDARPGVVIVIALFAGFYAFKSWSSLKKLKYKGASDGYESILKYSGYLLSISGIIPAFVLGLNFINALYFCMGVGALVYAFKASKVMSNPYDYIQELWEITEYENKPN